VHLVWIVATAIDIWLGFKIGKWLKRFWSGTKFETFSKTWAARIEHFIGKKGEKFVLMLLGVINFPWANSFLFSWLDWDYRTMFIFIFIGDAIWYALEWGINVGVRSIIPDPHLTIYMVVLGGLSFGIISKLILNRVLKKN
jgi:hypothetical protein